MNEKTHNVQITFESSHIQWNRLFYQVTNPIFLPCLQRDPMQQTYEKHIWK
jgi:hypothetical protein